MKRTFRFPSRDFLTAKTALGTDGSSVINVRHTQKPDGVSSSEVPHDLEVAKNSSNGQQLLSRDQIQAEYGLTRRWLELAAFRGQGPPMIKLSRRMVRYRRADFEAWLDAHVAKESTE